MRVEEAFEHRIPREDDWNKVFGKPVFPWLSPYQVCDAAQTVHVGRYNAAFAQLDTAVMTGLRTIRPVRTDSEVCSALMQFAYALSDIRHVVEAWSATAEDATLVWVFIDQDSLQVRRAVFDAETRTMDDHLDLEFDFYVLSVECRAALANDKQQGEQFYLRT